MKLKMNVNELPNAPFWLFIFLFVVFTFQLSLYINQFYVPESDFFDYSDKAIKIRQLQWPEDFKRPPLFSLTIAVVSTFIPGGYRELYSAELIAALAALGCFYVLYKLTAPLGKSYAFLTLWLWCLHPTTIEMAIKPKAEILAAFFILLAFWRYTVDDRKAYLFGTLASLTRYEGAVVLASFFVVDFFTKKEKFKVGLTAIISILPIIVWTFIQSINHSSGSFFSYYDSFKFKWTFISMFLQGMFGFTHGMSYYYIILISFILSVFGLYFMFRRRKILTFAIILYFVGFMLIEIIWPFADPGYLILITWIPILLSVVGIVDSWRFFKIYLERYITFLRSCCTNFYFIFLVIFSTCIFWFYIFTYRYTIRIEIIEWLILFLFLFPILFLFFIKFKYEKIAILIICANLSMIILLGMTKKLNSTLHSIRYAKAEFSQVAKWYDSHYQPPFRLLISQPNIIKYLTGIDQEEAYFNLADVPLIPPENFVTWLREKQITHVAYLSYNVRKLDQNDWSDWVYFNRGMASVGFLNENINIEGLKLIEILKIGVRWAKIYQVEEQ
ncbi:hypothetical protein JXO59_06945 [candidate division KSB1 bacterium]|nr:hypothetical protein [candidate division KSB1 bacterium]